MTWFAKATTGLGLILLAHACYSAQEYSALQSSSVLSTSSSLPLDIIIETIAATIVICAGLSLDSPALKPIRWRVWAGKIEREGISGSAGDADGSFGNPFRLLESRPGFVNIRQQRKEFAQWASGRDR